MIDETRLRHRFEAVRGQLDERGLRLMAAAEARAAGYGGIAAVARATGIARSTIGRGLADLDQPALPPGQVRRAGSGRKPVQEKDPTLLADLRRLVEPATHGDPMRPLLWVSKSHAKLADALYAMGHPSARTRSASCCGRNWATGGPTARPWRAPAIPIATASSPTSTPGPAPSGRPASR